ncbi:MAG: IS1595 family transposase, partial [Balneola sp.]
MPLCNKYIFRSRISEAKFRQILRLFCLDLTATQIAAVVGISRNSINKYLKGIRIEIARYCESTSPVSGQIEVDE